MVRANGHDAEWVETRAMPLGERDVLIVRASDRVTVAWVQNLHRSLQRANPDWSGTILVLSIDQDIHHLPEELARRVYEQLKGHFGDRPAQVPKRKHGKR